jgi:hypothetical protein
MQSAQLRSVYYAVKDGRDGNTVCTSWEEVRAVSAETDEFCPTDASPPIAQFQVQVGTKTQIPPRT